MHPARRGERNWRAPDQSVQRPAGTCHKGEPLVCDDIMTHPVFGGEAAAYRARGTNAFILMPLVKQGTMVACMCVTMETARHWSAAEIELVEEVAERTWSAVERARAEEALRISEERLRMLIENLPGGAAFIVDRELRYLLAVGEALTDAGFVAQNFVGKTIFEALGAEVAASYEPNFRQALAGAAFTHEHDAYGRSYITRGLPLRSSSGEIYAVLAVSYDITERKRAEAELQKAREQLEEKVRERTQELYEVNAGLHSEIRRRQEVEAERQRLLGQIVRTQEDERRRISREIHDSFGQQLTALRLRLEDLQKSSTGTAAERWQELQQMLKRLDGEIDFLAWELRPAALDELGLIPALTTFVEEWAKQFGVATDFHTNEKERFSYEIETNLYRIAQEALNNVSKHAQATQVSILLERRDFHLVLIVEDNGVGFDSQQKLLSDITDRGLGLVGMRERATLIGGTLEIESSPGSGTTIFARIPISPANQ
ncbi:MAG: PAS domain-containing protein [Blastocatellia bacterium]